MNQTPAVPVDAIWHTQTVLTHGGAAYHNEVPRLYYDDIVRPRNPQTCVTCVRSCVIVGQLTTLGEEEAVEKEYVYWIGADVSPYWERRLNVKAWIKIGKARSPKYRLAAIDTCTPHSVRILRTYETSDPFGGERLLKKLYTHHVKGEWYFLTRAEVEMGLSQLQERESEIQASGKSLKLNFERLKRRYRQLPESKPATPEAVASHRKKLGMTQKELADVIDVALYVVQKFESGELDSGLADLVRYRFNIFLAC